MRKSEKIAISIALAGVAVAILAWVVPPTSLNYEAKFYWGLFAISLLIASVFVFVRAGKFNRQKQAALDGLSEEISWAIHHIVNMPKPAEESWDAYALRFNNAANEWCTRVDTMLSNRSFFTQSDLIHFQRLGVIHMFRMTGHPNTDHAFSMLSLKLDRLREIIVLVQQRS